MRALALLVVLALTAACAPPPHFAALQDVDEARASAKAKEAERLAPQAMLHADELHRAADAAFADGQRAQAQILAEHAVAAYEHAFVLARLARANTRIEDAKKRLEKATSELQALDAQQVEVAAAADDLETRLKVARDALPVAPVEAASPQREAARMEAARAISLQGRLLCVAAGLLDAKLEGLAETTTKLDALDDMLAGSPKNAPIAEASRLRAECLSHLTRVRRPKLREAPEVSRGDELLEKLSQARLEPHRDDRGVVVPIRSAFKGAKLTPEASERLTALGQIGREQADTPLLVVVHSARGRASQRDQQRVQAAVEALKSAGAPSVEGRAAGDAAPVLPRDAPRAAQQNERIEVVFVTPSW